MWNLSAELKRSETTLYEMNRRSPTPYSQTEIINQIQKLADSGEPATIPAIASGLFSPAKATREASSAAVRELVPLVPGNQLGRLSELLGKDAYAYRYLSPSWDRVQPQYVKNYFAETKDVAVAGLLSLHQNGFVREAAVRFLANCQTGQEIPFLLVRQNDWVNSISEQAQRICLEKLSSEYLVHFTHEIDLIFHLLECKRRDLSKMVNQFVDLLVAPTNRAYLKDTVNCCSGKHGRTLVSYLLDRKGDHLADTIRAGIDCQDMLVRAKCTRHADDHLTLAECETMVDHHILDKFASVRQEAYELKARLFPDGSNDIWKHCLFDKRRSLRETAIFYLQKANHDVAALCRDRLSRDRNNLPALSGLSSTGDTADLELLLGYLAAPFASRRAEAIRGIGRIGSKTDLIKLQTLLLDESSRVVRATHQQLQPIAMSIDSDRLFELIKKCNTLVGRRASLDLLMQQGRWRSLSYLIEASASLDQELIKLSKESIWSNFSFNRNFTQPSPTQKQQIQQAIDSAQPSWDADFTQELRRCLSSFGFTF